MKKLVFCFLIGGSTLQVYPYDAAAKVVAMATSCLTGAAVYDALLLMNDQSAEEGKIKASTGSVIKQKWGSLSRVMAPLLAADVSSCVAHNMIVRLSGKVTSVPMGFWSGFMVSASMGMLGAQAFQNYELSFEGESGTVKPRFLNALQDVRSSLYSTIAAHAVPLALVSASGAMGLGLIVRPQLPFSLKPYRFLGQHIVRDRDSAGIAILLGMWVAVLESALLVAIVEGR